MKASTVPPRAVEVVVVADHLLRVPAFQFLEDLEAVLLLTWKTSSIYRVIGK